MIIVWKTRFYELHLDLEETKFDATFEDLYYNSLKRAGFLVWVSLTDSLHTPHVCVRVCTHVCSKVFVLFPLDSDHVGVYARCCTLLTL